MLGKKKIGGFENQRKNQDHQVHGIAEIGKNTGKSPGDLWRHAFAQTPVSQ